MVETAMKLGLHILSIGVATSDARLYSARHRFASTDVSLVLDGS